MSLATNYPVKHATHTRQGYSLPAFLVQPLKLVRSAIHNFSEPKVRQFVNGRDSWWYVFDPVTGCCIYGGSEAELQLWLQQNRKGKNLLSDVNSCTSQQLEAIEKSSMKYWEDLNG